MGYVTRPNPRGAQGFRFSLNQDGQQRSESDKSQDDTETLRHYFSFCLDQNRRHILETMALHPVASSRIGNVVVPVNVEGRQARDILPNPIPSSPLNKTTLTDLNRHVRGVCNHPKGSADVASIAMFPALGPFSNKRSSQVCIFGALLCFILFLLFLVWLVPWPVR